MEPSILTSTKKMIGLDAVYTVFDLDIAVAINSALSILSQLGVGPTPMILVDGADQAWADLALSDDQLAMVKTFIFLKCRLQFDPPNTSFVIGAIEKQIEELTWRISEGREGLIPLPVVEVIVEEPVW